MMENISVDTFMKMVILLGSFLAAIVYLQEQAKKATREMLKDEFEDIHEDISEMKTDVNARFDKVEQRIDKSDLEACRNFLVHAMVDIERGIADDALIHRFWDELDHYHREKQNSYIDTRVQALIDSGKLKPRMK